MTVPVDCANSATSSGGTTLELSGPLENTTITFLPLYCAASLTVSNRQLYKAASSPATVERTACTTRVRSELGDAARERSRLYEQNATRSVPSSERMKSA